MAMEIPTSIDKAMARKQLIAKIAKKSNVDENDLRWATWMIRSRRFSATNSITTMMEPSQSSSSSSSSSRLSSSTSSNDDNNNNSDQAQLFSLFGVQLPITLPLKIPSLLPTITKKEITQGFLLPLIDMANHSSQPNASIDIQTNKFTRKFDETSSFVLRAERTIRKGEEITMSYLGGDGTALEMLDKYGFFLEEEDSITPVDKKKDWKTQFTTTLEEDEQELNRIDASVKENGSLITVLSLRVHLKKLMCRWL